MDLRKSRKGGRRTREVYGNYLILSPDGDPMFLTNRKNVDWYLFRNIAEVISEEPPVVKLKFIPKGPGCDKDDKYSFSVKENRCVVCGECKLENLDRHHIIPLEYRKCFPIEIKNKNSHDVVLICCECHADYEHNFAIKLKQQIAERYNAPIGYGENETKYINAIKISNVFMSYGHVIPDNKLELMRQRICKNLDKEFVTAEEILELSNIDVRNIYNTLPKHGKIVMGQINDLQKFVEMWRKHFIDSMHPKFMPAFWDIKRSLKNL